MQSELLSDENPVDSPRAVSEASNGSEAGSDSSFAMTFDRAAEVRNSDQELCRLLSKWGLGKFFPKLKDGGFECMDDVLHMTKDDMKEVGIALPGERRRLMRAIDERRQILNTPARFAASRGSSARSSGGANSSFLGSGSLFLGAGSSLHGAGNTVSEGEEREVSDSKFEPADGPVAEEAVECVVAEVKIRGRSCCRRILSLPVAVAVLGIIFLLLWLRPPLPGAIDPVAKAGEGHFGRTSAWVLGLGAQAFTTGRAAFTLHEDALECLAKGPIDSSTSADCKKIFRSITSDAKTKSVDLETAIRKLDDSLKMQDKAFFEQELAAVKQLRDKLESIDRDFSTQLRKITGWPNLQVALSQSERSLSTITSFQSSLLKEMKEMEAPDFVKLLTVSDRLQLILDTFDQKGVFEQQRNVAIEAIAEAHDRLRFVESLTTVVVHDLDQLAKYDDMVTLDASGATTTTITARLDAAQLLAEFRRLQTARSSIPSLDNSYKKSCQSLEMAIHQFLKCAQGSLAQLKETAPRAFIEVLKPLLELSQHVGDHLRKQLQKEIQETSKVFAAHIEHFERDLHSEDATRMVARSLHDLHALGTWSWTLSWQPSDQYRTELARVERALEASLKSIAKAFRMGLYDEASGLLKSTMTAWKYLREFLVRDSTRKTWEVEIVGLMRSVTKSLDDCIHLSQQHLSPASVGNLEISLQSLRQWVIHLLPVQHDDFLEGLTPAMTSELRGVSRRLMSFDDALIAFAQGIYTHFIRHLDTFETDLAAKDMKVLQVLAKTLVTQGAAYTADLFEFLPDESQKLENLMNRLGLGRLATLWRPYALLELQSPPGSQEELHLICDRALQKHRRSQSLGSPSLILRISRSLEEARKSKYPSNLASDMKLVFGSQFDNCFDQLRSKLVRALNEDLYEQAKRLWETLRDLVKMQHEVGLSRNGLELESDLRMMVKDKVKSATKAMSREWDVRDFPKAQRELDKVDGMVKILGGFVEMDEEAVKASLRGEVKAELDESIKRARSQLMNITKLYLPDLAREIMQISRIMHHLTTYADLSKEYLKDLLNIVQGSPSGGSVLFKLGRLLEAGKVGDQPADRGIGREIVDTFAHFKDVRTLNFNERTAAAKKSLDEALEDFHAYHHAGDTWEDQASTLSSKERLQKGHAIYKEVFDNLFEEWHHGNLTEGGLADKAKAIVRELPKNISTDYWPSALRTKVPELLAMTNLQYCIYHSGASFIHFEKAVKDGELEEEVSTSNVLKKAHEIQVISQLHLLAYDSPGNQTSLKSRLMQIRTGEGKSIVLGSLSNMLAVLGLRVRVITISNDLASRDFKDFKGVFDLFGVRDMIRYSTIQDFSEDLVEANGNTRKLVVDMFDGALASVSPLGASFVPDIVLVDEVDVFMGEEFFGQVHSQVAKKEVPEVREILKFLFQNREKFSNKNKVRQAANAVFKTKWWAQLIKQHPKWAGVLRREVKCMGSDLFDFENDIVHYDKERERLGYIKRDGVEYDAVYRYRTAFTWLRLAEQKVLHNPEDTLKQHLQLLLPAGDFSYAEIGNPTILGVSGTLDSLSKSDLKVVNHFGIRDYSSVGSIYGKSNFRGTTCTLVADNDHFREIVQKANNLAELGRAVIVIFDTQREMDTFIESVFYAKLASKQILQASMSTKDKDKIIRSAASCGQITLTTRGFGRGVDYVSFDPLLHERGGTAVLVTFVPESMSEWVQLLGRVAREGRPGSGAFILTNSSLANLRLDLASLQTLAPDKQLAQIKQAVNERHAENQAVLWQRYEEAKKSDGASRALQRSVAHEGLEEATEKYLRFHEQTPTRQISEIVPTRIMILGDATGSMRELWAMFLSIIKHVLERVAKLAGNNMLELRWVAYRDYSDVASSLIQDSGWLSDTLSLLSFVERIVPAGGAPDFPEAVEHALQYGRSTNPDLVFLLGDAWPHVEKMGEKLENHHHWLETDYQHEAEEFAKLGVPIHSLVVGELSQTFAAFEKISSPTGYQTEGTTGYLKDAEQLTHLMCKNALKQIGGADMVAQYIRVYQ